MSSMTGNTLADVLAALATETPIFEQGARVLDPSDALTAILNEIDAAVLPVTLRFETGSRSMDLLVTGRRVHKVLAGGSDDVTNRALNPDDTDLIERAARDIADFADCAEALRVRIAASPADAVDMSDRVSVPVLLDALGLAGDDADASPHLRFLGRIENVAIASIQLTNRVVGEMQGSSADVAGLKIVVASQLSQFLDARARTCTSHRDPSLTLLADVVAPATSLGVAVFGENTTLFTFATEHMAKAQQAFQCSVWSRRRNPHTS